MRSLDVVVPVIPVRRMPVILVKLQRIRNLSQTEKERQPRQNGFFIMRPLN